MNEVTIIHISTVALDVQMFFDVVVDFVRVEYCGNLRNLTSKSESDISIETIDKMPGQVKYPVILNLFSKHLQKNLVIDAAEVIGEIHNQNPATAAMLSVMFGQVPFQSL